MTDAAATVKPQPPRLDLQTSHGPAWVVESAREIAPAVRERAFRDQCKDFRYNEIIEETLPNQFKYRYLGLENATTGDVTVQPFFYVDQDLTAGLPMNLRSFVTRLRKKWPRLFNMRMLMVGCATAEGQLPSQETWVAEALHEAIDQYRRHSHASIILLKDFPSQYRETLRPFSTNGYRRVPSMPAAKLELDFPSFDDFMQNRLSKVFRKNLRRKFRALEGLPPITMEMMTDGTPIAKELYDLYLQTHLRSDFRFEQLTPEYFAEIGQRMGDKTRFFVWRQSGRIIAFNLCMVHDGTLYDLDVGLDYEVALDLHLYFVTWRDMIIWSLENGVKTYHTGPLNYDPKLHLRLNLAPLDLYAKHSSPWINPFFKIAIHYLQPARHDPVLKKFPNSHEL